MNNDTAIAALCGLVFCGFVTLAGFWGKRVLMKLDSLDEKLGGMVTTVAVHEERLDNITDTLTSLSKLKECKTP